MFPQSMSRSEFGPDDSHPDPTQTLEQHLLAGFPPDLALDLVLNELVVRAAVATHASGAAVALARGDEMVCRAATGHIAPDLGIPLNTRDGISGACFQTRSSQLSADTESDPRVDPVICRRLGIRSILVVPISDRNDDANNGTNDNHAQLAGILEVFSPTPAAFSDSDQKLLEGFAEECSRIRRAAIELSQRPPVAAEVLPEIVPPELIPSESVRPELIAASPSPARRPPYEAWAVFLGAMTILAAIAVSFLIGSRVGWLRPSRTPPSGAIEQAMPAETGVPAKSRVATGNLARPAGQRATAQSANPSLPRKEAETASEKSSTPPSNTSTADELVVYEKGKVVFRMKPGPSKHGQASSGREKLDEAKRNPSKPDPNKQDAGAVVEAASITKIAPLQNVWIAPEKAESRLLSRTEPQYPPEARAAHRAGAVVLEVQVAEDGSVSGVRTLSGDPLLAAAATEAVRTWRYQPYRPHDRPSQFQTDVTLTFTLPD